MAAPTNGSLIGALTDGVTANATDDIPVNRAGADRRITPAYIKTYITSADLSMASHKLTNLADPTSAQDAATKAYVDGVAQGLAPKGSCAVATAAALPTNTYLSGVLTGTATGVLTVDGTAVALNDRVLVKNEVAQANNGIYTCTTAGAIGVAYVLTRATDMDVAAEIPGAYAFVEGGTVNVGAGFVVAGAGPYTIGTTAIVWTQFSGAGEISVTAPITKSGNTIGITSPLPIANGGTNATTAAAARVNIGVDQRTTVNNADYTILATDRYVGQTGTMSAARTLTLPAANAVNAGQMIFVEDESNTVTATNTIVIARAGSDTINGATSFTLAQAFRMARLISDGTSKWFADVIIAPQLTEYTTTTTDALPPNATFVQWFLWGAGGGGGSGRRGATGTTRGGGGGGCGGGYTASPVFLISDLGAGAAVTQTIGAGGTAGAAVSTDNTDGAAGGTGGTSTVAITNKIALQANGGTAGGGGTTAGGTAGVAAAGGTANGTAGAAGATIAGVAAAVAAAAGTGGGGGGGLDASDTNRAGGAGAFGATFIGEGGTSGPSGGTSGGGSGANAASAKTAAPLPTSSGSGGGSNNAGTGGAGGAGGRGNGAGGGGASQNGANSGAGNTGGAGYIRRYVW